MNIRNRLRKLENPHGISGKCQCPVTFEIVTDRTKKAELGTFSKTCERCGLETVQVNFTFKIGDREINEH